jgi:hypothetical protein
MPGLADAAAELEALAFRLRRAGDTELLREVTRAMRVAAGTVEDKIRTGLSDRLPDRYADDLNADLRLGTNVRTNERDPGVAITGEAGSFGGSGHAAGRGRKLRDLDGGRLTHPLFGERGKGCWFTQEGGEGTGPGMHSGWFSGPAEAAGPRVRAAIEKALEDVADKAVKGA